jgi:hypothetical protein
VAFRLLTLVLGLATAGSPSAPTIIAPKESANGVVTFRFASYAPGIPAGRLRYRCGIDAAAVVKCRSDRGRMSSASRQSIHGVGAVASRERQSRC